MNFFKYEKIKLQEPTVWYSNRYNEIAVNFLNDKHRYSEFSRDLNSVKVLKELFPNFDGYGTRLKWPSIFHNGSLCREVCIFDPQNKILQTTGGSKQKVSQKKKGGADPKFLYMDVPLD